MLVPLPMDAALVELDLDFSNESKRRVVGPDKKQPRRHGGSDNHTRTTTTGSYAGPAPTAARDNRVETLLAAIDYIIAGPELLSLKKPRDIHKFTTYKPSHLVLLSTSFLRCRCEVLWWP